MRTSCVGGWMFLGVLVASCSGGSPSPDAASLDAGDPRDQADAPGTVVEQGLFDTGPWEPPPPPPWIPPPGVEAAPGWRESTVPVCAPFIGKPENTLIWGDPRGVFLLVGISNNPFADYGFPSGWSVHFNDGSGWSELYRRDGSLGSGSPYRLAGYDGAPVWLLEDTCMWRSVDVGDTACLDPAPFGGNPVHHFFRYAADAVLYVEVPASRGDPARLRRFVEGSTPETIVEDYSTLADFGPFRLWTDASSIVVAHAGGITVRDADGTVHPPVVPPSPLVAPEALRGPEDAWFSDNPTGTTFGHYDGSDWTTFVLPEPACSEGISTSVLGTFSTASSLWVLRDRSLYKWSAGTLSVVLDWGCGVPQTLDSIHGVASGDEVYVTLHDPGFETYQCGGSFILWSDGETTRRF